MLQASSIYRNLLLLLPDPFQEMGTWPEIMKLKSPKSYQRSVLEVVQGKGEAKGQAAHLVNSLASREALPPLMTRH